MKSSAISGRTRNAERRLLPSVTFTIEGKRTDLNTYVDTERGNRFAGAKIKKFETYRLNGEALRQRLPRLDRFDQRICVWYTKDARRARIMLRSEPSSFWMGSSMPRCCRAMAGNIPAPSCTASLSMLSGRALR
jgi:hypothetical protein